MSAFAPTAPLLHTSFSPRAPARASSLRPTAPLPAARAPASAPSPRRRTRRSAPCPPVPAAVANYPRAGSASPPSTGGGGDGDGDGGVAVSSPSPSSSTAPQTSLKERSLVTLRGLSDLGSLALAHELTMRVASSAPAAASFSADAQLLLGGLIGLWTTAAWAGRQRRAAALAVADARALPDRWDNAVLYAPDFDDDEIPAAVAWLAALDQLDGPAAADLLPALAQTPRPAARALLADALACFPSRSNVAVAALAQLAADPDARVRIAAAECAAAYAAEGILQLTSSQADPSSSSPSSSSLSSSSSSPASVANGLNQPQDDTAFRSPLIPEPVQDGDVRAVRAVLERMLLDPAPISFALPDTYALGGVERAAWLADAMDAHVDAMLSAALSRPALGLSLPGARARSDEKKHGGTAGAEVGGNTAAAAGTRSNDGRIDSGARRFNGDMLMSWMTESAQDDATTARPAQSGNDSSERWRTPGSNSGNNSSSSRNSTSSSSGSNRSDSSAAGADSNEATIDVEARRPPLLFDSLNWSELHGICALALIPALYELAAVTDGSDLPLRFIGLGWLLALGGMASYPQSARLWSQFRKTMDEEATRGAK